MKRILRKYKYPPDQQEEAAQLVLVQAEKLCEAWMQPPKILLMELKESL